MEGVEYEVIGEYATMREALESTAIFNTPFKRVIMDDETEIPGQD